MDNLYKNSARIIVDVREMEDRPPSHVVSRESIRSTSNSLSSSAIAATHQGQQKSIHFCTNSATVEVEEDEELCAVRSTDGSDISVQSNQSSNERHNFRAADIADTNCFNASNYAELNKIMPSFCDQSGPSRRKGSSDLRRVESESLSVISNNINNIRTTDSDHSKDKRPVLCTPIWSYFEKQLIDGVAYAVCKLCRETDEEKIRKYKMDITYPTKSMEYHLRTKHPEMFEVYRSQLSQNLSSPAKIKRLENLKRYEYLLPKKLRGVPRQKSVPGGPSTSSSSSLAHQQNTFPQNPADQALLINALNLRRAAEEIDHVTQYQVIQHANQHCLGNLSADEENSTEEDDHGAERLQPDGHYSSEIQPNYIERMLLAQQQRSHETTGVIFQQQHSDEISHSDVEEEEAVQRQRSQNDVFSSRIQSGKILTSGKVDKNQMKKVYRIEDIYRGDEFSEDEEYNDERRYEELRLGGNIGDQRGPETSGVGRSEPRNFSRHRVTDSSVAIATVGAPSLSNRPRRKFVFEPYNDEEPVRKFNPSKSNDLLAAFLASTRLPTRLIENEYFEMFCRSLNETYKVPCANCFQDKVIEFKEKYT